ncbi:MULTISPECIES: hypothetical protein [Mumia]|uniref:hypothetical protein n=1 Tax=Mumia TaxID=1546255 RepID=UPI0014221F71|nr:hypothetical protein [Mumia sp. ZJ430]
MDLLTRVTLALLSVAAGVTIVVVGATYLVMSWMAAYEASVGDVLGGSMFFGSGSEVAWQATLIVLDFWALVVLFLLPAARRVPGTWRLAIAAMLWFGITRGLTAGRLASDAVLPWESAFAVVNAVLAALAVVGIVRVWPLARGRAALTEPRLAPVPATGTPSD